MRLLVFKAFCLIILISLKLIQSTKLAGKEGEGTKTKPELFDLNQIPSSAESPLIDNNQASSSSNGFGRGILNFNEPPPRSASAANNEATYSNSDSGDELIGSHQNPELLSPSVHKRGEKVTREQKSVLLSAYEKSKYLDENNHKELLQNISLTRKQVLTLFKNQRQREKRQQLQTGAPKRFSEEQRSELMKGYEKYSRVGDNCRENLSEKHAILEDTARKAGLNLLQITDWFNRQNQEKRRIVERESEHGMPTNSGYHFSRHQVDLLLNKYNQCAYPNKDSKRELARLSGLSEAQVGEWFRQKRYKDFKKKKGVESSYTSTRFIREPENSEPISDKIALKRAKNRDYKLKYREILRKQGFVKSHNGQEATLSSNVDNNTM